MSNLDPEKLESLQFAIDDFKFAMAAIHGSINQIQKTVIDICDSVLEIYN